MQTQLKLSFSRFLSEESGQAMSEYGATLSYIAVAMVVVFAMFFGIQNGFVHALSDVIASSLNKMANIQQ